MAAGNFMNPAIQSQLLRTAAQQSLATRRIQVQVTPQMAQAAADMAVNRPNLSGGVVAGTAIAGITPDDPIIEQIDQAELAKGVSVNDGMFDWSRGINPGTVFDELLYDPIKGAFRNAFLGFNAGIEEMESLVGRTPVAAYQGKANPLAASGRSDMFHAAVQGIQGDRVNLGDGFFPQSTLAPDVAESLATGMSLADATAGSMTQQQMGAPVTQMGTEDRERLQITGRGGTSTSVSLGRLAAITVAEPGSNEFHYISGMGDFAKQVFLDPADLLLGGAGQVRKLRRMPGILSDGENAGFVAKSLNGLLLGGSGRKTYLNRSWKDYLTDDVARGDDSWVKWFTEQTGDEGVTNVYDLLANSQKRAPDVNLVNQIVDIEDMDDMQRLLGDWGMGSPGGPSGYKLDTKFRGGFSDLGPGVNMRGNVHGLSIRQNIRGTVMGRLAEATNSKVLNVMDSREATDSLNIYINNLNMSDARRSHYMARAVQGRAEMELLAARGGLDESMTMHSFYYGLIKDITGEFVTDAKKSLRMEAGLTEADAALKAAREGASEGAGAAKTALAKSKKLLDEAEKAGDAKGIKQAHADIAVAEASLTKANKPVRKAEKAVEKLAVEGDTVAGMSLVLDRISSLFDDMEEYRAYWLNGVGDDMVFGGAKFTTTINGGAKANPSAITISQFLEQSIPLIDTSKIRALNRRTGWTDSALPQVISKRLFGFKDYDKFGSSVAMSLADGFVSKLWKPAVLLRVSWPVRVIGEEQLRMSGAMLAGTFNHPLQYLSVAFMHKNKVLRKMARLQDDVLGEQLMSSNKAEEAMSTVNRSERYGVGEARFHGRSKDDMTRREAAEAHYHAVNQLVEDPLVSAIGGAVHTQMKKRFAMQSGMTQKQWDELLPEDIEGLEVAWDAITSEDWANVDLSELKESFSDPDGILNPIRVMMLKDSGRFSHLARRAEADDHIDTIYFLMHQQGGADADLFHKPTGRWYNADGVGTDPRNVGVQHKGDIPLDPRDPLTETERVMSGQYKMETGQKPSGQQSPNEMAANVDVLADEAVQGYNSGMTNEVELQEQLLQLVEDFAGDNPNIAANSIGAIHSDIKATIRRPGPNSQEMAIPQNEIDEQIVRIQQWMETEVKNMDPDMAATTAAIPADPGVAPPRDYAPGEFGGEITYNPAEEAEAWGHVGGDAYRAAHGDIGTASLLVDREYNLLGQMFPGRKFDDLTRIEADELHDAAARSYLSLYDAPDTWDEAGDAVQIFDRIDYSNGEVVGKDYVVVNHEGKVTGRLEMNIARREGEQGVSKGQIVSVPLVVGDSESMRLIHRQMKQNPDDAMDAQAFLRMTTGGEAIADYMRRIGIDIPLDATPDDVARIIKNDPDLWVDISRRTADENMRPGIGDTSRTDAGVNVQLSQVRGKNVRGELQKQGQARPAINLREGGNPKLFELIATNKVGDVPWGTGRNADGARLTGKKLKDTYEQRIDIFDDDEWFDSMPQYLRVRDVDAPDAARTAHLDKAVNFLFANLMAKPTNFLSRSPAFKQFYWRRVANMYQDMTEEAQIDLLARVRKEGINILKPEDEGFSWFHDLGKPLRSIREASGRMTAVDEVITTFEKGAKGKLGTGTMDDFNQIDEIAKAYALEETKRLLYDLSNKHNWSDQLRVILPFGEAWYEVMSTWGRLMKENPRNLRRMQQTIQGGRTSDPFQGVDGDGEQGRGLFYTDDVTNEEMFGIPGMGLIKNWMLEGVESNVNFGGRLSALNITAQVIPGLGPLVQIPISHMGWASDPDMQWLQEIALPFGKSPVEVTDPKTWLSPITPGWVNTSLLAFTGESDEDTMRVYHNTVIDVYKSLLMNGWSAESPEEMEATLAEAAKQARSIYRIKMMSQFVGPTTQSPQFEVRFDAENDVDGEIWAYQNLATAYREILDLEQGDEVRAFKSFVERFGIDPMLFAVGKTQRVLPRAVTLEARRWEHDNEDLYTNPMFENTAYYSHPDPVDGEFYYDAYLMQLDEDTRVPLTPEQWALKRNQFLGRISYNNMQRQADRRYGSSPEGTTWLRGQYTALMETYPGYGQPITGMPAKPSLDTQVAELYRWKDEPRLAESPVGVTLERYLKQRDAVIRRTMQDLGYQTEISFRSGKNAALYRAQLRGVGERLVSENPDFLALWEQILSRELDEPEATLGPVNLAGVEF